MCHWKFDLIKVFYALMKNSHNMPPNTSNYALNFFTESCEDAIMY